MVIKHTKNVAKCAWLGEIVFCTTTLSDKCFNIIYLGELDSAEESDEISSEFDFQQEVLGDDAGSNNEGDTNVASDVIEDDSKIVLSQNSRELERYLENMERWSPKSRKLIVKKLLEQIINKRNDVKDLDMLKHVLNDNIVKEEPKLEYVKERINEDYYDVAEENNDVSHFLDNGKFNQKNLVKEDKSNEEVKISFMTNHSSVY